MPKVPYPYEVNGKLVTGNGSLIPICSLSNRSLLPSLTVCSSCVPILFSKCHIILLFSFVDPVQCQFLKVELKNDAYESQSSRVGIYHLSSTVNGRPSWTKTGSQAQYI